MRNVQRTVVSLVLAAACLTLAGAAFGGEGNGNGNGNGGTPPGQQGTPPGQQGNPGQPAQAQVKSADKRAKPAHAATPDKPAKPAHAATPDKPAKPAKPAKPSASASSHSPAAQASAPKVTICHKTGSASNPWTQITISGNAMKAHQKHGDIAVPAGGCPAGASTQAHTKPERAHDKVLICHRTSSDSNPYVLINIARAGWENGHSGHEGDKFIRVATPGEKPTAADLAWAAANCGSTTTPVTSGLASATTSSCPTVTTIERVPVGVWHATGSKTNPFVYITPSLGSAHYDASKHPDDRIEYALVSTVVSTGAVCSSATTGTATSTADVAGTQAATAATGAAVAAPSAAGVAGEQATIRSAKAKPVKKSAGGVLGAIDRIGRVASGKLPFTGLPLWIGLAVAASLLTAGLMLRRATRARS